MNLSRRSFLLGASAALVTASQLKTTALAAALQASGLKDVFRNDFLMGTAISDASLAHNDSQMLNLIAREFNAITAENAMKWASLHPEKDLWQWDLADRFVDFGMQHQMYTVGHTLVWHSQIPNTLFLDSEGAPLGRESLLATMDNHIQTLVGRYKGKIPAWDVVNEAIEDDGQYRQSPWFKTIGSDFIAHAFRTAHEIDPKAHLMYNDYNMALPKKRDAVVAMVRSLKKQGVPIHGIGMQGHISLTAPDLAELEKSIVAYSELGVRVHITELDVDVLPTVWHLGAEISTRFDYKPELDPYREGMPMEIKEQLAQRYESLFKLFLKHREKVERVTLWGTSDGDSWLNGFPIPGRTNYPLLFDRQHQPKAAYHRLIELKR